MGHRRERYGTHRSQVGDLWLPSGDGPFPVVVLIHGGFWRAVYTKRLMNGLASFVTTIGWAAWNIEYRRVGAGGGGGGWPMTADDVGAAIDHLASLDEVDRSRVVTCGHSAGGHLALLAASRHERVKVTSAISLAGVVDLVEASRLGLGGGAVDAFMGESNPAEASPAEHLPIGVPQVLIHGTADAIVPCSLSASYVERASAAGDDARYVPLEGVDHMAVIDPRGPAWPAIAAHLG